jgi:ribosomal protein S18 acetylase RimI-like enzyme
MDITIRTATLEDLKNIQDLHHKLCIKEADEFDPTVNKEYPLKEEGRKYFEGRITKDDSCAFMAMKDGEAVGYLVGGIVKEDDYRNNIKIAEVENMYVLESHRSKGIGKNLFEEFIKWAKESGAERVMVVASAQNDRAIEFYEREGFEKYDIVLEKEI